MIKCLPEVKVLSTVPFRFKGINKCDAIAFMPISFNFVQEMLEFMRVSLDIQAFDLFCIPAFYKRIHDQSQTVLNALNMANKEHSIRDVVIFQNVDFHEQGKSNRFNSQIEEDLFHKAGLVESRKKILDAHPNVNVIMIYVCFTDDWQFVKMVEILPDGSERVRLMYPYKFNGIYECDTSVIMCMDFRFRREFRACVRNSLDIDVFGIIGLPGSSKRFLEGSESAHKAMQIACGRYGCKKIISIHHADCGAYGWARRFPNAEAEELFHYNEMAKMREKTRKEYAQVEVTLVYARLIEDSTKIQFVRYLD